MTRKQPDKLVDGLREKSRTMRRISDYSGRGLLIGFSLGCVTILLVLMFQIYEEAFAPNWEQEVEPDNTALFTWKTTTWSNESGWIEDHGERENITLIATWNDPVSGKQRSDSIEIATTADGPTNTIVNLTNQGFEFEITEIRADKWITFDNQIDAVIYFEQDKGPTKDAVEERWLEPGDFILEYSVELWGDSSLLSGFSYTFFVLMFIIVMFPEKSMHHLRSLSRPVTSKLEGDAYKLSFVGIFLQSPRHWLKDIRELQEKQKLVQSNDLDSKVSLMDLNDFSYRLLSVLSLALSLSMMYLHLIVIGEIMATFCWLMIGLGLQILLRTGSQLKGREKWPSDKRMRFILPGRDGWILTSYVCLILSTLAIPLHIEIPFVFELMPNATEPYASGIRSAFWGSMWVIIYAMFFAVPISIGGAIWLEEYAPNTKFKRMIQALITNLAGVPAVVFGLFGLALLVHERGIGWGMGETVLAAGITMASMAMPTIVLSSQEALRAVPQSLREAAFAVGCSRWQVIRHHVLPYAIPGMMTGTILAMSRIMGEAAPLILIGAVTSVRTEPAFLYWLGEGWAEIFNELPLTSERSIVDGQEAYTVLPVQVYSWTQGSVEGFKKMAAAASIVLLTMLVAINSVAIILRQHFRKKTEG